jgi:hypothetical protein
MTDERKQALAIAELVLDGRMNAMTQAVPGDPDCDFAVLARQYGRALETIRRLAKIVVAVEREHTDQYTPVLSEYSMDDLRREIAYAAGWPDRALTETIQSSKRPQP